MNSKNEEVAALEALRDSSAELVKYLDAMNSKLMQLNQQNELSLRVLENWSSVIAITKATTATDKSDAHASEILRKPLDSDSTKDQEPQRANSQSREIKSHTTQNVDEAMSSSGIRANGFQTPLSRDQVTSWVLQPFMMSCFIAFVAKLLDREKCIWILVPTGILILVILWCWFLCESRDPAVERPKSRVSLLPIPPKMTRYCTLCCKTSPGLDHHCTWLNTCIADNNYEPFYYLVVAAALQTMLQAVIGILMATIWLDQIQVTLLPSWHTPIVVLLWIHNAIILSLANSYFLLAGFHTYLLLIRSGTYDFILENGNDGICARMLKCRCFTKSKSKRKSGVDKKRSLSKTTPVAPSSKVVAAPSRNQVARGDGQGPTTQDLVASAAKQREVEQWKAEWLRKYGSDDSDDNSTSTETTTTGRATDAAKGTKAQVGAEATSAELSAAEPTPAKRRATNASSPNGDQQTHDQVKIEMSAGVNESEGIIEDIESGVGEQEKRQPQPSAASTTARGVRTEL